MFCELDWSVRFDHIVVDEVIVPVKTSLPEVAYTNKRNCRKLHALTNFAAGSYLY
jgi:hypothetical protein